MRLNNLRDFVRRQSGLSKHSRRSSQLRFLPRADTLEGRALLSTITVKNTNDSGAGSLRDAIMKAGDGAVIQFAPKLDRSTITLTSGELDITKNVQIVGPGANELTVSGGGTSGVFDITADGLNVTISGLTIANGSANSGAGIINGNGTLTVVNDTFSSDQANGSGSGATGLGGAIYSPGGSLTVTGSTFTFDRAVGRRGRAAGARKQALRSVREEMEATVKSPRAEGSTWQAVWRRSAAAILWTTRPLAAQGDWEEPAGRAETEVTAATVREERSIWPVMSSPSAAAFLLAIQPPAAPGVWGVVPYSTRAGTADRGATARAVRF